MGSHCVAIPAESTLQQSVDEHILSGGQRCFFVNRGSDTVGLMTLHRIMEVPRDEWQTTSTVQAMLPLDKLMRISPDNELCTALQQMDRDGVNKLPVMTDNQVVGMLSREDVISFLTTVQELDA
jgi:predicted transcriptional regulator